MEAQNSTFKTISSLLHILDAWISVTGGIIFLAGGIALAQLYQLLLVERKEELQTLRYFGARFGQILSILMLEILSITILGMAVGTALGIGLASMCFPFIEDKVDEIAGLPFPIEETIIHPWTGYMVGGVIIFVLVLIFPMLWRLRAQKGLHQE
jgi:predicted lysophospholipase L1 biosynthesis ABC-type transport system permease subunit